MTNLGRTDVKRLISFLCLGGIWLAHSIAAPALLATGPSPVLAAAQAELSREMGILGKQPTPPYFLSYEITDTQFAAAGASFGKLLGGNKGHDRQLDIDIRVGNYDFDNTHLLRGEGRGSGQRRNTMQMPLDDDPVAIRALLWNYTDREYKLALEQFTKAKTNNEVKVEQEDKSTDFSHQTPEKFKAKILPLITDLHVWEERARKYTAPFARFGNIYEATADVSGSVETRWFVSSEGSAVETCRAYYRVTISASTKALDGMVLPRYESYYAATPEGLPDDAAVLQDIDRMITDLEALRSAPVIDAYTGPAILSGRASGVFFHEVFGHRIEGHRQKSEDESQTFKKKIGETILPTTFSVYFDPTRTRVRNDDLVGAYEFDNQGVKAQRLTVVDHGVFKNFLMSRTPIEGFPQSNGHGRKQAGFRPVARQSNLIVETSHPLAKAELKRMLLDQIKQESKPFGLYFDDIQGGFTLTNRQIPNAFNVLPVMVYKVYPDGREELVRGVNLIGTPLTAFSKITAADDEVGVFNGVCGAESGGVPVATVSPGIFVSQIEVQKQDKSQERVPILPAPFEDPSENTQRQK